MKNLFNILSNTSEFFNEKRFVLEVAKQETADKVTYTVSNHDELTQAFKEISCDSRASFIQPAKEAGRKFYADAMKQIKAFYKKIPACKVDGNEEETNLTEKQKKRNEQLDMMGRKGFEFKGRDEAWKRACQELADEAAGKMKVTDEEIDAEIARAARTKDGETGNVKREDAARVALYNKKEKFKVTISQFLNKGQGEKDEGEFQQSNYYKFNRALAEMFLIRKEYKKGEKDPNCQVEIAAVKERIKDLLRSDTAMAVLFPGGKPKTKKPEMVAKRSKIVLED